MPTKDEWVGKLRNHPWKKIMVRLLWDMREDTSALDGGFQTQAFDLEGDSR